MNICKLRLFGTAHIEEGISRAHKEFPLLDFEVPPSYLLACSQASHGQRLLRDLA